MDEMGDVGDGTGASDKSKSRLTKHPSLEGFDSTCPTQGTIRDWSSKARRVSENTLVLKRVPNHYARLASGEIFHLRQ